MRRGLVRELESGRAAAYDFAHAKVREAAYEATSLAGGGCCIGEPPISSGPMRRHGTISAAWCRSRRTSERRVAKAKPRRPSARRPRGPERYANREAATHLETALALGHPDVGGLQLALGESDGARRLSGRDRGARDRSRLATEARLATIELGWAGSTAGAATWSPPTRTSSRPRRTSWRRAGGDASEALAGVLAERALVAHRSGDETAAIQLANRALEGVADSTPDGDLAARAARPRSSVSWRSRRVTSRRRDAGSAGRYRRPGRPTSRWRSLRGMPWPSSRRDPATSTSRSSWPARRWPRAGSSGTSVEAVLENTLADLLHDAGRRESMAHLKLAVAIFAEVGGHPGDLEPEIWKLVEW